MFSKQHAMSQLWKGCVTCYRCDLRCFITVINKGLNDVKCSKASNTLCVIHDLCVVILLLFQSTFPAALMFPALRTLPQRWRRKTFLWKQLRNRWVLKNYPPRVRQLLLFKALQLFVFPHICHSPFLKIIYMKVG